MTNTGQTLWALMEGTREDSTLGEESFKTQKLGDIGMECGEVKKEMISKNTCSGTIRFFGNLCEKFSTKQKVIQNFLF